MVVRAQHDLREQMLEQAKSFLDAIQQLRAELLETIEREIASLERLENEEPADLEQYETEPRPSH